MKNKKFILIILIIFSAIICFDGYTLPLLKAQNAEQTRGVKPIEYAEFLPKKYAGSRPKKKTISKKQTKLPKYKYVQENNSEVGVFEGTEIGITVWRLREITAKDKNSSEVVESTRILKRVKGQSTEVVARVIPERIGSNTPLADGELIRFAIEVPTEGYLYIISQELYVNGQYSDPYLVFPSRRDIGKTNKIVCGKLLFIPNDEDNFQISKLKENDLEISEEAFTVIVAKEPLAELPPLENDEPRKLSQSDFQEWKERWGGKVFKFEQETTAKLAITQAEKKATPSGEIILSETDLLPQTIYHVSSNNNKALLFTASLKIKK